MRKGLITKTIKGRDYIYSNQSLTNLRKSSVSFGNIRYLVEEKKQKHIYLGPKIKLEEK